MNIKIFGKIKMEPFDDPGCQCYQIEAEIDKEFPEGDWNMGKACKKWKEREHELQNNNIQLKNGDGCCCQTCGRPICGWCV